VLTTSWEKEVLLNGIPAVNKCLCKLPSGYELIVSNCSISLRETERRKRLLTVCLGCSRMRLINGLSPNLGFHLVCGLVFVLLMAIRFWIGQKWEERIFLIGVFV